MLSKKVCFIPSARVKGIAKDTRTQTLALSLYDGTCSVIKNNQLFLSFKVSDLPCRSLVFTKNHLVIGCDDGCLYFYTKSFNFLLKVKAHSDFVRKLVYSKKHDVILSCSDDLFVNLYCDFKLLKCFSFHEHFVMDLFVSEMDGFDVDFQNNVVDSSITAHLFQSLHGNDPGNNPGNHENQSLHENFSGTHENFSEKDSGTQNLSENISQNLSENVSQNLSENDQGNESKSFLPNQGGALLGQNLDSKMSQTPSILSNTNVLPDLTFLSCSLDCSVKVTSTRQGVLKSLKSHQDGVNSCVLKDNIVITASDDLTAKVHKDGLVVKTLCGHSKAVNVVRIFSNHIFTGSEDGTVRIYTLADYKLVKVLTILSRVWDIQLMDGTVYVASDSGLFGYFMHREVSKAFKDRVFYTKELSLYQIKLKESDTPPLPTEHAGLSKNDPSDHPTLRESKDSKKYDQGDYPSLRQSKGLIKDDQGDYRTLQESKGLSNNDPSEDRTLKESKGLNLSHRNTEGLNVSYSVKPKKVMDLDPSFTDILVGEKMVIITYEKHFEVYSTLGFRLRLKSNGEFVEIISKNEISFTENDKLTILEDFKQKLTLKIRGRHLHTHKLEKPHQRHNMLGSTEYGALRFKDKLSFEDITAWVHSDSVELFEETALPFEFLIFTREENKMNIYTEHGYLGSVHGQFEKICVNKYIYGLTRDRIHIIEITDRRNCEYRRTKDYHTKEFHTKDYHTEEFHTNDYHNEDTNGLNSNNTHTQDYHSEHSQESCNEDSHGQNSFGLYEKAQIRTTAQNIITKKGFTFVEHNNKIGVILKDTIYDIEHGKKGLTNIYNNQMQFINTHGMSIHTISMHHLLYLYILSHIKKTQETHNTMNYDNHTHNTMNDDNSTHNTMNDKNSTHNIISDDNFTHNILIDSNSAHNIISDGIYTTPLIMPRLVGWYCDQVEERLYKHMGNKIMTFLIKTNQYERALRLSKNTQTKYIILKTQNKLSEIIKMHLNKEQRKDIIKTTMKTKKYIETIKICLKYNELETLLIIGCLTQNKNILKMIQEYGHKNLEIYSSIALRDTKNCFKNTEFEAMYQLNTTKNTL